MKHFFLIPVLTLIPLASFGLTPAAPAPVQTINRAQPTANVKASAPPANAAAAPVPAAPQASTSTSSAVLGSPVDALLNEDLIRSLRDPFQLPSILMTKKETPKTDLEIYPLKDFKLNGVITGPKKTRAMLTTPNNKVFFVRIGDKIGVRDGTITGILPDSIKITEYYSDEHGKRASDIYELTMSGELVSLNKKEEL
jgi:hypothetical protein